MDIGILYGEALLITYILLSFLATRTLSKKFSFTPLRVVKTKHDLKVTLFTVSLILTVPLTALAARVFPSPIWDVEWLFILALWFLPLVYAILQEDFKIIGMTRQGIVGSVSLGIIGFLILIALLFSFHLFYPTIIQYYRAPVGGGDMVSILIVNVVLIFFNPAVTEELVYRGLLQGRLQTYLSPRTANLTQAAIFGLVHITNLLAYQDWLNPFNAFLSGTLFGYLYQKTGNILGSVSLHWLTMSLAYVIAFVTPA